MKKYLILGSGGQIGAALAEYAEQKGNEVIRFDTVHSADHDLRKHANSHLDKAVAEADYVFFLAFDVGGSRYLKKYQETYDFVSNNIKLMNTTFEALKKHKKKFIFASSQMSNMGYSNYGLLKALGESYTKTLGGIVVKFWNVYGLEHDPDKAHVITDLIKKAKKDGIIELITDGNEERQFLHSEDCSECLLVLAENDSKVPRDRELHVTSFKWTKIIDVANIISKHFNNIPVKRGQALDTVQQGKRNEPDPYIFNYWRPKIEIEDGIKKIIHHMNGNK